MRLAKSGWNGQLRQNVFGMRIFGRGCGVVSVNCFKGKFDRMCAQNRFGMELKVRAISN